MSLLLKALISGLLVAAAGEVARRASLPGAILVALPLASMLAVVWLYRDTDDTEQVAELSWSSLWVVIPSLVFLVALPVGLQAGLAVWATLGTACAVIALACGVCVWAAREIGLDL